ncbi:PAS domain-containing sensor histidine kinase [Polyangium jinanense]|uniref:histidine kinase n=1 Tax=Polyangium jinanense TaxID=2829994 RepID=A0A9X3X8K7_9BACT|nr:PAS domain-containing sensor histidine kinase [Polyangium jinanense]MDC3959288.1 PAS domain-containing sensor histidine kinase [Polyangium jinanense]MDC3985697.1 PAS domain-containing sensor histidine kinase [Polyangium jinanense]
MFALHACRRSKEVAAAVAAEGARALGATSGLLAVLVADELSVPGTNDPAPRGLAAALSAPGPTRMRIAGSDGWAVRLAVGDRVLGVVAFQGLRRDAAIKAYLSRLAMHCAPALARVLAEEAELSALRLSRELLRAVTEGTHDCVFVKDLNLRYVMINSAGARVFGLMPEDVVGKDDNALFSPEDAVEIARRDREILHTRRTTTYECSSITSSGTTRYWQSTKGPWYDEEGRVVGLVGISRDVTARRRAEEAQRLLAEVSGILGASLEYESTFATMARLLVPSFADGFTMHVEEAGNRYCLAALGRGAAFVDDLLDLVPLGRAFGFGDLDIATRRELEGRGIHSLLVVPLVIQGHAFGHLTLLGGAPGRFVAESERALAEEIARRAGMAIDRARLYREVQEASRLKDEFLAVISHELRTPLTAILGWTGILRRDSVPEASRGKALETIERNAQTQARLIEDLMDTTSMIAGTLQLDFMDVDLVQPLTQAVRAMRPVAEAKGIRLDAVFETKSPLPVLGDDLRLRQVIENLLGNALKFTPPGGSVEIGCRRGDKAILWVKDDGVGISPTTLPHVFERFRQGDSSSTRSHGGLGLGLSIVRYLVEAHGGAVIAESPGKGLGATFTVELPLHVEQAPEVTVVEASPAPRFDDVQLLVMGEAPASRDLVTGIFQSVRPEMTGVHKVVAPKHPRSRQDTGRS